MKHKEFVEKKAEVHGWTKKQAAEIVDKFWEIIVEAVKKGDEVVTPYGKFVLVKKEAREGRNPITGATVKIPAKIVPKFRPNKAFKELVAGPVPKKK